MKHFGDITKTNGADVPPVEVIIGGSPCQDLSIAGKRQGLEGKRSGLFMEQIRVIKEMREKDAKSGRTGTDVRPRFMVWENVPGAFSSRGGQDFAAVLEETIRIAEPEAPDIHVPKKGWSTAGCYMGAGWSVAWRVLDAQFWGVPQRRRRIALVADFAGRCAPEVLFERESLSGHSEQSGQERKGVARDAEKSTGTSSCSGFPLGFRPENVRLYDEKSTTLCNGTRPGYTTGVVYRDDNEPDGGNASESSGGVKCFNPWDSQSERCYDENGVWHSLNANSSGGQSRDAVVQSQINTEPAIGIQGSMIGREDKNGPQGSGVSEDVSFTLTSADRHAVCYDNAAGFIGGDGAKARSVGYENGISPTLRAGASTSVVFESHDADARYKELKDVSETVTAKYGTGGGNQPIVVSSQGINGDIAGTLDAHYANCPGMRGGIERDVVAVQTCMCQDGETVMSFQERAGKPGGGKGILIQKDKVCTLSTVQNQAVCMQYKSFGEYEESETGKTLLSSDDITTSDLCCVVDCRNGVESPDMNGTLQAKGGGGTSLNLNNVVRTGYIVRRLTPMECERLQGFPDGFTDIGEWTDSKGKKRKLSDSARYKALGNSIAIPPWLWVLSRLNAYCNEHTLGSLFDGIGGFPLIWEFLNGKGSAVWANEIEEFCIALSKLRFPD